MKLVFSFHGLRILRESDGLTLIWLELHQSVLLPGCLDCLEIACCRSYCEFLGTVLCICIFVYFRVNISGPGPSVVDFK